eukprot:1611848-Alexandrium_andersonii.AAC.1
MDRDRGRVRLRAPPEVNSERPEVPATGRERLRALPEADSERSESFREGRPRSLSARELGRACY